MSTNPAESSPDTIDDDDFVIHSDEDVFGDPLDRFPLPPGHSSHATSSSEPPRLMFPAMPDPTWKIRALRVVSVIQEHYIDCKERLTSSVKSLDARIAATRTGLHPAYGEDFVRTVRAELRPLEREKASVVAQVNELDALIEQVNGFVACIGNSISVGSPAIPRDVRSKILNFLAGFKYDSFPIDHKSDDERLQWQREVNWLIQEGIEMQEGFGKK